MIQIHSKFSWPKSYPILSQVKTSIFIQKTRLGLVNFLDKVNFGHSFIESLHPLIWMFLSSEYLYILVSIAMPKI